MTVSTEYFNYSNIFSAKYVAELLRYTRINDHAIKLEKNKQPLFKLIYSLGSIELKTLKTYIKTDLVNDFILPSKSPAIASMLFDRMPHGSFYFCVDY